MYSEKYSGHPALDVLRLQVKSFEKRKCQFRPYRSTEAVFWDFSHLFSALWLRCCCRTWKRVKKMSICSFTHIEVLNCVHKNFMRKKSSTHEYNVSNDNDWHIVYCVFNFYFYLYSLCNWILMIHFVALKCVSLWILWRVLKMKETKWDENTKRWPLHQNPTIRETFRR